MWAGPLGMMRAGQQMMPGGQPVLARLAALAAALYGREVPGDSETFWDFWNFWDLVYGMACG